ncbi:unknown [Clostridium sp. CAG:1193]|nr:unknown [Clostridium sp. CAG:1193]
MGSEWIYLTNLRFDISNKLYLSKYFNFYLRNLNSEEENFFFEILKNEYKKIIKKYGLKNAYEEYKIVKENSTVDYMMKSLRMFSIADYFSLCELKILVRIYLTESNKETYEPVMDDFKTNNISKVLRNYLRRLIVIDYDRELLLEKLKKYDNSKTTEDALILEFRKSFINFYNYINRVKISYDIYNYRDSKYNSSILFLSKLGKTTFESRNNRNLVDKFINIKDDNFDNFMFIIETFYSENNKSYKKEITDYVTLLEMFVTHSPSTNRYNVEDSISKQFVEKISASFSLTHSIKNKIDLEDFKKELKYMYNYRSKLLHGEVLEMNKQLNKFLEIPYYSSRRNNDIDKDYYKIKGIIEKYMSNRLEDIFRKIFELYVKNYLFFEAIK